MLCMYRWKRGFTLIELLVVVAIIALLISILLPSLAQAREQAKVAKCLASNRTLIQATHTYFNDWDDNFPFMVKVSTGGSGICSWSYGGKTSHDYWESVSPYFYHVVNDRPLNPYILSKDPDPDVKDGSGNILVRTEVRVLQCPSDKMSYQRLWDEQGVKEAKSISAYDDIGTSYHFNLAAYLRGLASLDFRRNGVNNFENWFWKYGGAAISVRDAIRTMLLKHPSTYTMFYEDPMDWGLGRSPKIPTMGNHRKYSRHVAAFLDGHAKYDKYDTRGYCGPGWNALIPEWVVKTAQEISAKDYYYTNTVERTCDPPD